MIALRKRGEMYVKIVVWKKKNKKMQMQMNEKGRIEGFICFFLYFCPPKIQTV